MEQEDIKKLYIRLSKDFSMLSFEEVLAECLKIAKKFYACYPLLFGHTFNQSHFTGFLS